MKEQKEKNSKDFKKQISKNKLGTNQGHEKFCCS